MPKSLCIALALLSMSSVASAEIFKCVGEAGRITYQNFPCEFDSIGSVATQAAPPAVVPPTDAALPLRRGQVVSVKAADTPTGLPGEPRVGMTAAEVRATTWGAPVSMVETEFAEGLVNVWSYSNNRSVEFNHKGRVRAVLR